MYPHTHTHAPRPCLSSLAACECTGEAEGETQTQREAVGTCKCKHVSPPVPDVSSHYIQQPAPLGQLGYGAALLKAVGLACRW